MSRAYPISRHTHGRQDHVRLHGGVPRERRPRASRSRRQHHPRAFFGGAKPAVAAGTVHDFTVLDIDKKPVELSAFAGKALLIVNVASA